MEVITYSVSTLKALETVEWEYIRMCLGLPLGIANVGLYQMVGMRPLHYTIMMRIINYFNHVQKQDPNRWIFQALSQQLSWAKAKGWCDDNYNITGIPSSREKSYWLKQVITASIHKFGRKMKFCG